MSRDLVLFDRRRKYYRIVINTCIYIYTYIKNITWREKRNKEKGILFILDKKVSSLDPR